MMEVQKPADVDNTDTEDEVAVPVPIHGDEPDRLLDIEVTGLPFHVADLSRLYGECHRGVVAAKAFEGGDFISAEGACAYVCVNVQQAGVQDGDDDSHSAMAYLAGASKERPYEQCPPELSPPHMDRGLYAALTGLLIRDCERIASMACESDEEWSLHGQPSERFPRPEQVYEVAKRVYFPDKGEAWDLDRFARLYGIVQCNATAGITPFSEFYYGVGFFPGLVFINHSCKPNAIAVMEPGKLVISALEHIDEGDEITVAYRELPFDLLTPDMVRLIHRRAGIIVNDLGCRCEVCRAHLDEEARQMMQAGLDPSAGRIVDLDLMPAWDEITRQRLELDSRLRDLVMIMFQMVHHPASVKAAQALRASYDHFLCPPKAGAAKTDFCPDLAYMLGHLYITTVIHIPGYEDAEGVQHEQTAADYLWWTEMYADVLDTSDIHLPHALTSSLAARCYGTLLACGWYTREEAKMPPATEQEKKLFPSDVLSVVAIAIQHKPLVEWHKLCESLSAFAAEWKLLHPGQTKEDMITDKVFKALRLTKAWGGLYGLAKRRALYNMQQFKMLDEFITSWVGLRMSHIRIFRHVQFLGIIEKTYPIIGRAVTACAERIADTERRMVEKLAAMEAGK